nr:MAG TPA: hypothetical protein [Caudoviricetes sp.]
MKLIKYWHVKLYRNLSTIVLSKPMETLIFEGYSKDKPVLKSHDEGLIELFTAPDQLETKTIRTCGFSSMVCTPVYEEDKPLETETDSNKHSLKSDFFTIEIQVPTVEDLNKIFAEVCRDVSHLTPSHSVFTIVFEEVMKRVNASISASMTTNPKLSHHPYALRGKQITPIEAPIHKTDDKVHDHACVNCFTDKGPCLGECNVTDTNKVLADSFEAVTKPVIQWLNENSNPHAIILIDPTGATLHTGEIGYQTEEFLKD